MSKRQPLAVETATGEQRWKLPMLTQEQVRALPASAELVYAARALGIHREAAYRQASTGALEYGDERVPVRRVCSKYRVLRSDLMRVLGIAELPPVGAEHPSPETLSA